MGKRSKNFTKLTEVLRFQTNIHPLILIQCHSPTCTWEAVVCPWVSSSAEAAPILFASLPGWCSIIVRVSPAPLSLCSTTAKRGVGKSAKPVRHNLLGLLKNFDEILGLLPVLRSEEGVAGSLQIWNWGKCLFEWNQPFYPDAQFVQCGARNLEKWINQWLS